MPPPRGRAWNASTINGNRQCGAGSLQNELYGGRFVWNKVRMVKVPDTGRRISRPNPKSEWQAAEAPDFAITRDTSTTIAFAVERSTAGHVTALQFLEICVTARKSHSGL